MRRFALTLATAVVFAGLLAYVLLTRPTEDREDVLGPSIVDIRPSDVQSVAILRPGGSRIVIRRDQGRWQLVEPARVPTSDSAVEDFLAQLSPLRAQRVVAETAEDRAEYGLAPPQATLELALADGTVRRLFLGGESPLTRGLKNYYLQEESAPRIYLVTSLLADKLTGSADLFRERQLVKARADQVQRLRVVRSGLVVEAEQTGGPQAPQERRWRLKRPFRAPGDAGSIEGLLRDLEFARVEEFVDDNPTPQALQEYGLAEPAARVEIEWAPEDGKARTLTLLIGAERASSRGEEFAPGRYVQVAGEPYVYRLSSLDLETVFELDPQAWVRRRVVGLAREELQRFSFTMAGRGGPVSLERHGDVWQLEPGGKEVPADEVDKFIDALWGLSARGQPVDSPPEALRQQGHTAGPFVELTVAGTDGSPVTRLAIEPPAQEGGGGERRLWVEQASDRLVYRVDEGSLNELEAMLARWTAPSQAVTSGPTSSGRGLSGGPSGGG